MKEQYILRAEKLFDVSPVTEQEFLHFASTLIQLNYQQSKTRPVKITKLLIIQDIWYFFYYGDTYENYVIPRIKAVNELRMEFIRLLAKNEFYQLYHEVLKVDSCLRTMVAINLTDAMFKWCKEVLLNNEMLQELITQMKSCFSNMTLEESSKLQSDVVQELKYEYYKDYFHFSQLINQTFHEAERTKQAILSIIGQEQYDHLSEEDMYHFLQSFLAWDGLGEIVYWHDKMADFREENPFLSVEKGRVAIRVLCVQQDDCMEAYKNLINGIASSISQICQEEQSDFVYIPFAQNVEKSFYSLKGKMTLQNLFNLSTNFIGGTNSINYKGMLNFAFMMLRLEVHGAGGNIGIICTEAIYDELPDENWKRAVLRHKQELEIKITVFVINNNRAVRNEPIWFADEIFFSNLLDY